MDPFDLIPRYVGQSRSVLQRYDYHCFSGCDNQARTQWIYELRHKRRRPMLLILDRVKPSWGDEAEEWWIREGLKRGWALFNVTRLRKFKVPA